MSMLQKLTDVAFFQQLNDMSLSLENISLENSMLVLTSRSCVFLSHYCPLLPSNQILTVPQNTIQFSP